MTADLRRVRSVDFWRDAVWISIKAIKGPFTLRADPQQSTRLDLCGVCRAILRNSPPQHRATLHSGTQISGGVLTAAAAEYRGEWRSVAYPPRTRAHSRVSAPIRTDPQRIQCERALTDHLPTTPLLIFNGTVDLAKPIYCRHGRKTY